MDAQAILTTYSLPLTILVLLTAGLAWYHGHIQARHYAATMGTVFAVLAYLAWCDGHLVAGTWYAVVAAYQARLYWEQRVPPLDGSHEAL